MYINLNYDSTRLVRIVGCEYRLSESELLGWLGCFGEVLSEITEERFDTEGLDPSLPPIGNGTYQVKIRIAGPFLIFIHLNMKRTK